MKRFWIYLFLTTVGLATSRAKASAADSSVNPIFPLIFDSYKSAETVSFIDSAQWRKSLYPMREFVLHRQSTPLDSVFQIFDIHRALSHSLMVSNPEMVQYIAALLPDPPVAVPPIAVAQEEIMFDMPVAIDAVAPPVALTSIRKTHWLHKFDGGVQFSQAYLSPNWYQGGSNNLSLIVNFLWDVKLNETYHPNLLFENSVAYKLGLYSTPNDLYHKYSISEDLFQWNIKFGVKAFRKWFYSITSQFKTQILNNYGENSLVRKAAFMSPGDFNLGLGMTYSTTNKSKSLKFNASVAPLSYNLKTCIDTKVDPTQFNIPVGAKTYSEVGSNGEVTLDWNVTGNINYRSRLFLFSNYKNFLGDWENTLSFSINRFLSTQIYAHLRYDTSTEASDGRWRHWMLKEILSFGFRYAFSTK